MKHSAALRWCGFKFLLVAAVLFATLARAQNANTGEIKGAVMDASGAVVPGTAVSLKNVQTGLVTQTKTNQSGLYDVPFLAPGNYTITFSKQGFRDFVREGVGLQDGVGVPVRNRPVGDLEEAGDGFAVVDGVVADDEPEVDRQADECNNLSRRHWAIHGQRETRTRRRAVGICHRFVPGHRQLVAA